jgi:hypothetical protein
MTMGLAYYASGRWKRPVVRHARTAVRSNPVE